VLTNADTREEKREDGTVYVFSKRIGTKGAAAPLTSPTLPGAETIVAIIRAVPKKRLRVLELARELLDGDGELDLDAAADRSPDVSTACVRPPVSQTWRSTRRPTSSCSRG